MFWFFQAHFSEWCRLITFLSIRNWIMIITPNHTPWVVLYVITCQNRLLEFIFITMTSWWARWRLKSPASPLFAQRLVLLQIKENIKAPCRWPLCGWPVNSPYTRPVTRKMFPFDDVIMPKRRTLSVVAPSYQNPQNPYKIHDRYFTCVMFTCFSSLKIIAFPLICT